MWKVIFFFYQRYYTNKVYPEEKYDPLFGTYTLLENYMISNIIKHKNQYYLSVSSYIQNILDIHPKCHKIFGTKFYF